MNEHDSPSEPVLRVSDRRHFTDSGERRPDVEAYEGEPTPAAPPAAAPSQPAAAPHPAEPKAGPKAKDTKAPPPRPERLAAREINFANLMQDLYATGMMQLGAELQPGQPGRLDLEGARETIDLIGLLQQKTHGNLDAQEERLLATVLYELRMAYVEVQRAASSRVQPARVAPPPPRRG